ncbi:MAG: hypothetical protein KIT84_00400 [Labilithrix sp.]|nr:hypothetical protein [Labilithrix sp.]MCW5809443.1 hypothetical protein [Labilithrix sp.]
MSDSLDVMDRPALRALLALLDRGLVDERDVAELASLLMKTLDVQALSFGPGFGFSPLAHVENVEDAWRAHHTRNIAWDRSPAFLATSRGAPFRVKTHSSEEERRSPLFRGLGEFYFEDAAISLVHAIGAPHFMAFYRARGAREFDDDDAVLLKLLHPHLSAAFATALPRAAFASEGENGPVPVGWVDLPSESVHLAPGIEAFVATHLGVESAAERRRFRTLLVQRARRLDAGADSPGPPRPLPLNAQVRLEAARVDPKRSGPKPRGEVASRTFFALCPSPPDARNEDLLLLLTPAQRAVASRAARGASLPSVAKELGISLATARVHLREVYRRLDVHDRTELRRRIDGV